MRAFVSFETASPMTGSSRRRSRCGHTKTLAEPPAAAAPRPGFRPQPFEQLVKVYREMGHGREARAIAKFKESRLPPRQFHQALARHGGPAALRALAFWPQPLRLRAEYPRLALRARRPHLLHTPAFDPPRARMVHRGLRRRLWLRLCPPEPVPLRALARGRRPLQHRGGPRRFLALEPGDLSE